MHVDQPCEDTLAVTNQDVGLDTLVYLCVYRDHGWRQKYGAKVMAPKENMRS